jgi:hypothetical protein
MKSLKLPAFAAYAVVFSIVITLAPAQSTADATKAAAPEKKPANQSADGISTSKVSAGQKLVTSADWRVIAHLEKRDQRITIKSGPGGLVYSVTGKDGKVLHRDLSEKELQAKAPELYVFIKTAVGSGIANGATTDASVRDTRSGRSW